MAIHSLAPDGENFGLVLATVRLCAEAWEPDARLIGNVRAGDIARAVTEIEAHVAELEAEVARLRAIEADAGRAWAHLKGVVVTPDWTSPDRISLAKAVSWLRQLADDRDRGRIEVTAALPEPPHG